MGWTEKLSAAGFDETLGTVWVAEGLLMYLNPETVPAMLAELAARSAPGSVFVGQSVTESLLAKTRQSLSELLRTWCFGCAPVDYSHGKAGRGRESEGAGHKEDGEEDEGEGMEREWRGESRRRTGKGAGKERAANP